MGITRIYLRNKVQQMIGNRSSIRHYGKTAMNTSLKQLSSREEGYRVKVEEERKTNEEKKQQRLDRKSELAIMNLKLLAEAIK